MSRYLLFFLWATLIVGCASKETKLLLQTDKSLLSFPVVLSKLDAVDNQNELEDIVKKRIEKNSFFSHSEAIEGVVLNLSLVPSCQKYGVKRLIAVWSDENNGSRQFKAEYPIKVKRYLGGRSFEITLERGDVFEPKHPILSGFSDVQSAAIYSDAKWLHDGLLPTSDILKGIKL
jgi:hypothetical protein